MMNYPDKLKGKIKMKRTFETFKEVGDYEIDDLTHKHPSCFNGNVRIKKYKITIEEIEETNEVLAERLQQLWDKCDNWHHWGPLETKARKLHYKLKREHGNKNEKLPR
jgi:ribosomal protein L20A (L18A)